MALLDSWARFDIPVIGMLHCPPLNGSPGYSASEPGPPGHQFNRIRDFVLRDAEALIQGGVNGLMLENFGDTPFFPGRVPAATVAALTALAIAVKQRFSIPLGINVLRNDGQSALAIADASQADFIRVNVLCGARVTDQGLIQGIAHELLRERVFLGLRHIRILADVDVKHSAPVAPRPIDFETLDLVERAHADAIIVSGQATGSPTNNTTVEIVSRAAAPVPVFVGSGVSSENVAALIESGAKGLIVGSSLKEDGRLSQPIDVVRVRLLMDAVHRAQSSR